MPFPVSLIVDLKLFLCLCLFLLFHFRIRIPVTEGFVHPSVHLNNNRNIVNEKIRNGNSNGNRNRNPSAISNNDNCNIINKHRPSGTIPIQVIVLYDATRDDKIEYDGDDDNDDDDNDDVNSNVNKKDKEKLSYEEEGNRSSSNHKDDDDIESARLRFENLVSLEDERSMNVNETSSTATALSFSFSKLLSEYENGAKFKRSDLPNPPPLSGTDRHRKMVEIQLLECLTVTDDNNNDDDDDDDDRRVIGQLWEHWYGERGNEAKSILKRTDDYFSSSSSATMDECEKTLIDLIENYGVYFVEPVNRLATLYYLRKKFHTSYQLCQLILSIKPYHIGALSGIVQVCLCLRDVQEARRWAKKGLPSRNAVVGDANDDDDDDDDAVTERNSFLRNFWVKRAISNARERLDEAERMTREEFFGEPDKTNTGTWNENENNKYSNSNNDDAEEEELDSWQ